MAFGYTGWLCSLNAWKAKGSGVATVAHAICVQMGQSLGRSNPFDNVRCQGREWVCDLLWQYVESIFGGASAGRDLSARSLKRLRDWREADDLPVIDTLAKTRALFLTPTTRTVVPRKGKLEPITA